MELYSSFMKLAPLLILKLFATGRVGPSEQGKDGQGQFAFAGDVALMVAVVVGGFISLLVLGDVLTPTVVTRGVLVLAGCLSLLVLASFKLRQIASLYRVRPRARSLVGTSSRTSAGPGEFS